MHENANESVYSMPAFLSHVLEEHFSLGMEKNCLKLWWRWRRMKDKDTRWDIGESLPLYTKTGRVR